jgi:YHS domain-containing protein
MIATLIVAGLALGQAPKLVCPVMGDALSKNASYFVYKDIVFGTCCSSCVAPMKKNAEKYFAKPAGLIGYSQFDVISHEAIAPATAAASTDYNGVRYYFSSTEHKTAFDKDPKGMSRHPAYEVDAQCIVTGEEVKAGKAIGYRDAKMQIDGKDEMVRVYFCCGGCPDKFDADPAKFLAGIKPTKAGVQTLAPSK